MRRSFILALSCLSLLFTLTACGDKKPAPSQENKAQPAAGSMNNMKDGMGKMNDGMGSMKQ
jgi:predicted small lipoprotein YifL